LTASKQPLFVTEATMATNDGKFVCYYRVSTGRQGKSGLGLDAQRAAVATYLNGGSWQIFDEFTEVESGKRPDRPALDKALAAARLHRASLVVSKVDRLTRSVAFLSRLLEAGVDVRFADLPQIEGATGRFLLQQMVAVAELEAGMISARTKAALAAAKKRGKKLGGNRGVKPTAKMRARSTAVLQQRARPSKRCRRPAQRPYGPSQPSSTRPASRLRVAMANGRRSRFSAPSPGSNRMERSQYVALRREYEPDNLTLLIVAESPPESGLYFYNPVGRTSEPIFSAFMEQLAIKPTDKGAGLRELQRRGWLLIDATYEPIDKKFKSRDPRRDAVLLRDYPLLKRDILALSASRQLPIMLIKENVCRVLNPPLTADGFRVLNRGRKVYLPINGNQGHFRRQFGEILGPVFS
jgi:DNA invertase Pin-like site-specific DNA recombinase